MTVKNTTDDLATTLREAREWDRRFLAGERPLVESRRLNPPAPPPQVQAIIEAVERDLTDAPRPPAAPRPVPASASTRAPVEQVPADVHCRLHAALIGQPYLPVPAGVHRRLAEALSGQPYGEVPATIHARLAYGLGLSESADPVPPGLHTRLYEALTGEPAVTPDLHERLRRALEGGAR